MKRSRALLAGMVVLLASCDEFRRDNPFDPQVSGPSGPMALSAVPDSFRVKLSWRVPDFSGVSAFRIERAIGDSTAFSQVAVLGPKVTTWIDTGARSPSVRWYRIAAQIGDARSAFSAPVSAIPLTRAAKLRILRDGKTFDTLRIPDGTVTEAVLVENTGGQDLVLTSLESSQPWARPTVSDSTVPAGGSRIVRLDLDTVAMARGRAWRSVVELLGRDGSRASFPMLVQRPDLAPPIASALQVDSTGVSWVALSWNANSQTEFVRYVLERSLTSPDTFVVVDSLADRTRISWKDSTLGSLDSVRYRIVVVDSRGRRATSQTVSARTAPGWWFEILVRDSAGRPLPSAKAVSVRTSIPATADSSGRIVLLEPVREDSLWDIEVDGFFAERLAMRPPARGGASATQVLQAIPRPQWVPGSEGTDLLGLAVSGDSTWIIDRNAEGTNQLDLLDLDDGRGLASRSLGSSITLGSSGPLAISSAHALVSFPLDGSVRLLARGLSDVPSRIGSDTLGAPWGVSACGTRFAVAGSAGVGLLDPVSRTWAKVFPVVSLVDDIGASHGGRVACSGGALFLADDGGSRGLVRIDTTTGTLRTADLDGRTIARFLSVDSSVVAVGTVGGKSASVQIFGTDLEPVARIDLDPTDRLTALSTVRGAFGEILLVAGIRTPSGTGEAKVFDARGLLRGTIELPEAPVEFASHGGRLLAALPSRVGLLVFRP